MEPQRQYCVISFNSKIVACGTTKTIVCVCVCMSTIDIVFYPGYQTEHSQMYSQAMTSFARRSDCRYLVVELVEIRCRGSTVYQEAFLEASITVVYPGELQAKKHCCLEVHDLCT